MFAGGDCSGAPQLVVPSLSPPPLSKRVPRMFRFITINYFVSGRRQNGHFGLLLSVYNLQDGQCVEDRPSTSGIWRKLEKLGAPICGPSPSQVNKRTGKLRPKWVGWIQFRIWPSLSSISICNMGMITPIDHAEHGAWNEAEIYTEAVYTAILQLAFSLPPAPLPISRCL